MSTPLPACRRLLRAVAPAVVVAASSLALGATAGPAVPVGAGSTAGPSAVGPSGQVASPHHRARHRSRLAYHRSPAALPTGDRSAVNTAYWAMFARGLDVSTGWTGDLDGCRAGTTSAWSRWNTLRAINFVRRLGGLSPVRFGATLNARAQATALMMAANDQLSHYPTSSWRCYSRTGAQTAARSNLALAYPELTAAGLVQMYMDDPGSDNRAVGHRRWVLNPFATVMGSGSTGTANALQVIGPSNRWRPNPAYVSWPTRGWFPDTLEPHGRWSLSAGDSRADFSRARVHVHHAGRRVPVHRYAVQNGYAQPTLVWQMPRGLTRSGSYQVVVSNIHHKGSARRTSTRYQVRFFTPTR
ncbi:MAG TPA: CAP domain-containing protein [Marmoricola sp.]